MTGFDISSTFSTGHPRNETILWNVFRKPKKFVPSDFGEVRPLSIPGKGGMILEGMGKRSTLPYQALGN